LSFRRAHGWIAAVALAALLGCGTEDFATPEGPAGSATEPSQNAVIDRTPTVPVVHDLVQQLPVAKVHWQKGWKRPRPSATKRGVTIEQLQGSSLTYYFEIPESAVLSGSGIWQIGNTGSSTDRTLRVAVETEDGGETLLTQHEFMMGQPSQHTFEHDLSAFSGKVAAIQIRIGEEREKRRNTKPTPTALRWVGLELQGEAPGAPEDTRAASATPRNIILILFDTLRADRTEPYGATNVATPALNRLAARGVTFTRAHSNATWTTPSVASMLTGLRPASHKINGSGWLMSERRVTRLGSGLPYLPFVLQSAGYRTRAVVTNFMISSAFGFDRGFDQMIEYTNTDRAAQLPDSSPEALAGFVWENNLQPWVESQDVPFFLYLHELNPHDPYLPPSPYAEQYDTVEGTAPEQTPRLLQRFAFDSTLLDDTEIAHLEALYRGEIAYMDRYLEVLLEKFEAAGLLEDSIIAFVSDHGESFNEHGRLGHSDEIHETLLRVPALLSAPGLVAADSRSDLPFSLVDLSPTLLDLAGVAIPDDVDGRSMLPYLTAGRLAESSWPVHARARFGAFWYDAILVGPWKFFRQSGPIPRTAERTRRLFDLRNDPGETRDLMEEHPIVAGALEQMMGWQSRLDDQRKINTTPVRIESLAPDVRRNLEELGYFGPAPSEQPPNQQ
jgi:arylsulfatase A-like enzyme